VYGVLALGDSITNGGGELQWGVALQSWAQWTARGLGLPYTGYAADGATVADVVGKQIPRADRVSALPRDTRYDVGCLFVGVNDVRRDDWDAPEFGAGYRRALAWLGARCERTLCVLAPERLGRPATPRARVAELNRVVTAAAADAGALVLDLRAFGARNQVMADRVHPTAFGQIGIAERALAVLAADGLPARVAPASLITWELGPWPRRLQADWTYAYRAAKRYMVG
jgi:lysophospholipase L1-like esterase